MEYLIITFKSRQETLKISKLLNSLGFSTTTISTPKEAGVGCGLSIKTELSYFYAVKSVLIRIKTQSFVGFFKVIAVKGKSIVKSMY